MMKFCDSEIDPTQFELFVGALFVALGYSIEHNGKTHDGGIDLIVRHYERGKGVVQVKQYRSSKVTEPQIRDLYGALCAKQEVEYGIMVVLSDCTKEAKTWPDREGVTNLAIWTHKELVAMLQQKGNETLIEFIRILLQRHDRELRQSANGLFVTPKHHRQQNAKPFYKKTHSNHGHAAFAAVNANHGLSRSIPSSAGCAAKSRRRGPPSSTLSSAKKRGVRSKHDRGGQAMAAMAQNWAKCKFTVNDRGHDLEEGNGERLSEQKDAADSPLAEHSDAPKGPRSVSPMAQHVVFGADSRSGFDGEISPKSTRSNSADSSLLIDESQSDEEPETTSGAFSNGGTAGSMSMGNGNRSDALNTNLMWSISNVNRQRRKRRPWLPADDSLIMAGIAQFGSNWMESADQWEVIFSRNSGQFSQDWTLKDIRKHYHRALKPKLMSSTNQIPQTSSNHSAHSLGSLR